MAKQKSHQIEAEAGVVLEPRMTRSRKRLAVQRERQEHTGQKQPKTSFKGGSQPAEKELSKVSPRSKPKSRKVVEKKSPSSAVSTGRKGRMRTLKQARKKDGNATKVDDPETNEKVNGGVAAEDIKETSKKIDTEKDTDNERNREGMAGFAAKGGKFVGAHTSSAGGLWNAVAGAITIKGRAYALFLKSQRQWKAKPLEEDVISKFQSAMKDSGYHPDFVLPHGSYLINCGSPNPETLQKSRETLLDEVRRCQRLGLNRYNFHPGSTCGEIPVEKCLDLIGESINQVLDETSAVTIVVENMSCQGNTVGGKFEELKGIIDRTEDKSRIGVCLDTCHAFAAGYDLSTADGYDKMTDDFDKIIGFQYLKGVHLNDSKGKVGCHLDRHENIGKGFIGLKGFKRLMNDERFEGIPMLLETPPGLTDAEEIELLYDMVD